MSDEITVDPQNVQTPNLGLNKPLVGGDDDIWGDYLNENADILDTVVTELRTEVQQLSGALLFIGTYDVVADYAEFAAASGFPNGPLPAASAANFNSYLVATTAGTGHGNAPPVAFNKGDWLVSDGSEWVHLALGTPPGGAIAASTVTVTPAVQGATNVQSALQQLDGAQAQYLPLSGLPASMAGPLRTSLGNASNPALQVGTAAAGFWALGNTMFINAESTSVLQINGTTVTAVVPVTLPAGDPAQPQYAASKAYVDEKVGSVPGGAIVSPVAPVGLNPGTLWWDSTGGQLYLYYDDGSSRQYVSATNLTGLANAATKADVGTALNNVGRNLIHNSMFNVAQRAGPWATQGAYTLDRWQLFVNLDSANVTQVAFGDGQRASIGDEAATYGLDASVVGNAGAAAYSFITQKLENVRRLAGKTVTISLWAYIANGPATRIGIGLRQSFGTGGSPSADVDINATQITATATPTRYSVTIALPSVAGKTLGTNGDSYTRLALFLSAGANTNALAGGIGVQQGDFIFWGVQLEVAQPGQTQPTPLEKPDPELQLRQCQRFFVADSRVFAAGFNSWGANAFFNTSICFPVQMRASPTIVRGPTSGNSNASSDNVATFGSLGWQWQVVAAAAGGTALNMTGYTASADL